MNCHRCATPLPHNSRFCLSCGADVSGEGHERTLAVDADPELLATLQTELGGDFLIEKELGRGGMAVVFLGHDAHLGRKVAIKLLPPELTLLSGGTVERFKREARMAATLDHPNIIPVYRVSTGGKLFWYVMKYLEGEALAEILEREAQLAVDRSAEIIRQVADGLGYAHKKNVIHRDVKPANVMIDAEGRVTVTDFGIAKALDANTLTASGAMIGTPYYMSPEQCSGKRVGPASDQYSLAIMAYQMLGGHVPFTGESVVDIIHKHVMDTVPPLGVLRPRLPDALVRVIERGLAKSPDDRFASVTDFAKGFTAAAQGLDVTLAPPTTVKPQRASRTALVSPVPGALRTARGRMGRKLWMGGGALLLVMAVWTGVAVLQRAERAGPGPAGSDSRDSIAAAASAADSQPVAAAQPAPSAPAADTGTSAPRPSSDPSRGGSRLTSGQTGRREPTSTGAQPAAPPPGGPSPAAAPAPQPAPVQPEASAPAFITVGSRPLSAMTINGRTVAQNPVSGLEVPAGLVTIVFTVTDTSGVWSVTRTFELSAGERRNLGRIQLTRP